MKRQVPPYRDDLVVGARAVLGSAITAVENARADARAVLAAVAERTGRARVVGVTGPPGVGKSTLVSAMITVLRERRRTVGVLAVDPSSPFGGGALLGDRIRMSAHARDPGVFVRSVASRGHLGGLSRATAQVIDVLDGAGFDTVIVETVGSGQAETEIMHLAQTVVVVAAPGLGDEIQAIKAGILEIADIFVVNKADSPSAERTRRALHEALREAEGGGWTQPIIPTVATEGRGVGDLLDAIERHAAGFDASHRAGAAARRARRQLAVAAAELASGQVHASDEPVIDELAESVRDGRLGLREAAEQALRVVARGSDRPSGREL